MNGTTLTIAVAQLNPTMGDVAGNVALVRQAREAAMDADLLVTTELVTSGYPPEDLVTRPAFLASIEDHVNALAQETKSGPAILLGTPWKVGYKTYNAMLLLDSGHVADIRLKHDLPNYGVFDEKRVFTPGELHGPIVFRGFQFGLVICEDFWTEDACALQAKEGAQILIVPNGSPYDLGKSYSRMVHAKGNIENTGLAVLYTNQVGGQDELVFDGTSFVMDVGDEVYTQIAPSFASAVVRTEWQLSDGRLKPAHLPAVPAPEWEDTNYAALVLGLRDYVNKNGFPGVILGLSGGIDSALTAAIAVDALGAKRVRAVMMPSPYTSQESLEDAAECARLLGIQLDTISIEPGMKAMHDMLHDLPGLTGENIQSRLRGMTLMALSNRDGFMLLSTGNKSEFAVGYTTLYGDMCGGFAVLKDVYKTEVFRLSRWRNTIGTVMPERVITKPPSAELKPNQTDQDTLPPYDVLDDILQGLVEGRGHAPGHDPALVKRIWRMVDRAEYKRRQSPPGPKITSRAFGKERRFPITNKFNPTDD